ncbi:hypothetical protein UFOVP296_32 [uncultured Caudovirales phage]|uniref:Capsid assembly protein n=1 Tax=uncultured Caudovirales phage TaxID=2100421 RepID=A0A6J5RZR0_9CAUD|nr:hypothetical protein UFOVP296_32 [uncultured Caudovirales phage]CAB4169824.1 hypothetical protein UFOVP912_7 [uncultured Caudovirales phage]CAB4199421.1 hypothetical protein UFOVP1334_39 [uncultured Caudovirales phage]
MTETTTTTTNLLEVAPEASIPVAAPVASSPWLSDDGKFTPGWLERLPAELQGNPALTTMPGLEDLAKSYVETKRLVGTKLQAPGLEATPQEIAKWRKTVGAPDDVTGYGEIRPEDYPEESWDAQMESEIKAIAHKHHTKPEALREMAAVYAQASKRGLDTLQQKEAEYLSGELSTLRREWGNDFDTNIHAAKTFAATLGLDIQDPIFQNHGVVMAMTRGAKLIMGDKLVQGTTPGMSGGIEERIRMVQTSPDYQGQNGEGAQMRAQQQLHALYNARKV